MNYSIVMFIMVAFFLITNFVAVQEAEATSMLENLKGQKEETYKGINREDLLYLYTDNGIVRIQLLANKAPNHVERIKALAREGFYDGMPVHRAIKGFMVQMGDPTGTGTGRSALPNLVAEFNDMKHVRGVVSMARGQDVDSANSQFFIVTADSAFLDGQYTAFGVVIEGMEIVDSFKTGRTEDNGMVDSPSTIQKVRVAADTKD